MFLPHAEAWGYCNTLKSCGNNILAKQSQAIFVLLSGFQSDNKTDNKTTRTLKTTCLQNRYNLLKDNKQKNQL
jgi:hypothetical protein